MRRVHLALKRHGKARPETLIHDHVQYWSTNEPPNEVWAFPHLLTMRKHEMHRWQQEYRLAFGIRSGVFDFENVECRVNPDDVHPARIDVDAQCHRMKLRLGSLETCCRIR